ncbi:MAG: hypothetical protein KDD92_01610, partial [Caldilineaceae bacterium]|nr:hypothetical protein [Caldilineaceae bacterium]
LTDHLFTGQKQDPSASSGQAIRAFTITMRGMGFTLNLPRGLGNRAPHFAERTARSLRPAKDMACRQPTLT